jgi:hypothetical protein
MGLFDTIQNETRNLGRERTGDGAPAGGWRRPFGAAGNGAIAALMALAAIIVATDRLFETPLLREAARTLYIWLLLLAATALMLGVANVIGVHMRQIAAGRPGWVQSLALVIALFVVFVTGMLSSSGVYSPLTRWLFDNLIAPGQRALFSLFGVGDGRAALSAAGALRQKGRG